MRKKRKVKKRIFIFSILFLLILLIVLLELQYNFIENIFKKTEKIVIEEECSQILNNLVHKVTDNSGCDTLCLYECEISEKTFKKSEFKENPGECNECTCYCR